MINYCFKVLFERSRTMSYADEVFIRNCRDILTHGVWDTDQAVRPH